MILRNQQAIEVPKFIDDGIVVDDEFIIARKQCLEFRLFEFWIGIKGFEFLFQGLNWVVLDFVDFVVNEFEEALLDVANRGLCLFDAVGNFTECSPQCRSVDHL